MKLFLNKYFLKLKYKFYYSLPYKMKCRGSKKKAFISYISRPFYDKSTGYVNSHQNVLESIAIVDVFNELGYSVEVHDYNKKRTKIGKYDVIFGLEPNFIKACNVNEKAIKIYYATGAYCEHQNIMIRLRTNYFNKEKQASIPYRRLVEKHTSAEQADFILQIGTKHTIETYPETLRNKISIINQSSFNFKRFCLQKKKSLFSQSNFVWFGSGGSILKGLDLILDFFLINKHLNIHIVGSVESDFILIYQEQLKYADNIKFYGFMDVNSEAFYDVMYKCAFHIFPSASEGCPGSVINGMNLGVIPITSSWASPDSIGELGYKIKKLDKASLNEAINWTTKLTENEIIRLFDLNVKYANSKYNLKNFKEEMKLTLKSILAENY